MIRRASRGVERLVERSYLTMADQPRRVNFFDGLLLTAADLAAEQEYHRQLRYLHNRLHGYGAVSGLDVTAGRGGVRVSPGMAIDRLGREIVVATPLTLALESHLNARGWPRDLVITWGEVAEGPLPRPEGEGTVDFTRWVEQPELSLVARGQAPPEALVLARVTPAGRGLFSVDTSVRRPLGPASLDPASLDPASLDQSTEPSGP